jgi:hypothetical protein
VAAATVAGFFGFFSSALSLKSFFPKYENKKLIKKKNSSHKSQPIIITKKKDLKPLSLS